MLYHGVDKNSVYRVGVMLLDLKNPRKVLARAPDFIMEPETYYEKTGLVIDATEPVPFGTHFVLFGLMHVILFHLRTRFPREELIFGVVVALLANLGLFLGLSLVALGDQPASGAAWLRLFADLGWSQLFIVAVAPWFLALQQRALELGRVDLADESRRFF